MKQLLSFGHLHVLSSDSIELIIDKDCQINDDHFTELAECLSDRVNKPYGLLINMVNGGQLGNTIYKNLQNSLDIGCIALLQYSLNSSCDYEQRYKQVKVFDGFRLGRSRSLNWLDLYLTSLINSTDSHCDLEAK